MPEFGTVAAMLDRFDRILLNLLQRDSARTADSLAQDVPLSPSAIARRIRRHRRSGLIARSIALLAPRFTEQRIRVIATIQLANHGDTDTIRALETRLADAPAVQFVFAMAGSIDLIAMVDCATMREFNETFHGLLANDPAVSRFECYFIKREIKFAPFVDLIDATLADAPHMEKGAADRSATP